MRAPLTNTAATLTLAALPVLTLNQATSHLAHASFAAAVTAVLLLATSSAFAVRRSRRPGTPFPVLGASTLTMSWVLAITSWQDAGVTWPTNPAQWACVALLAAAAAGSIALNVTDRPGDELGDDPQPAHFFDHPAFTAR